MEKLDKVDNETCIKYMASKMLAWLPSFHPKTTGPPLLSKLALIILRAPPTALPLPPMGPARNVAWPSLMPVMRAKQPSNC
jgi:hypothetical protein